MTNARRVALEALTRIRRDGAYANLAVPAALSRTSLDERDRGLVTELVYGATRMRRACDYLVDRFLVRDIDADVRDVLRLGAYQLHFLRIPSHAAVSTTVDLAPGRTRGLVNAVLRKVATAPVDWPDDATRLSYPNWIVERLVSDLGEPDALAALQQMNESPTVTIRDDGYVQDPASLTVAELVGARAGERVADLCAAPGGKATAMAASGAWVAASDIREARADLVAANTRQLGAASLTTLVADGRHPPYAASTFDRVLVDAPCSGLGVLRRRPDARWRIKPDSVERLVVLQTELIDAAAPLVKVGGTLAFSLCTLTAQEALGADEHLAASWPDFEPLPPPREPWQPYGRGARLLPQAAGTDGMTLLALTRRR